MMITLFGVVLNGLMDYVLMFGKAGLPALGVMGTGLASALVFWAMCLSLFSQHFRVFDAFERPSWPIIKQLLSIGIPIGFLFGQALSGGLMLKRRAGWV